MLLNKENVKRLIIYFIFDKDGIVDDYILYMLNALKEHSTEIAVVVNGKLTVESREKLTTITPMVMARDNSGFDVWAYKTIIDYYGWEKLGQFDEVIMMNFTIMGPVYPLEEMFSAMNAKDLDFWGITMYHKYEDGDPFGTIAYGYIPTHIQSHFIAVRKSLINTVDFQYYWDNMGVIRDYKDAVGKHEAIFTKHFEDKGYKWDVYADLGPSLNNNQVLCSIKELIEQKRCPIFKRRSFMQDYKNILTETIGQSAPEMYKFIKENTDYDVDMIWQNILRLENQADIKKNMQLNYILPTQIDAGLTEEQKKKKVAIILHIYFEELIDYCLSYTKSMPDYADVYVTVGDDRKMEIIKEKFSVLPNKVTVIKIKNRGRDVSALLVGAKKYVMDYDYVLFMHDKKVVQIKPETVGYGFSYKCFENLLPTKEFVTQVIKTFEENPRLGLLTPPPPNHADYFIALGMEWSLNFDVTKKLADKLGLNVSMTREKEPIAPFGSMFWFRPCALKRLFDEDWEYEDFPEEPLGDDGTVSHAIERIHGYVVQNAGYYPAWVFSDKCASIEITNLHYMLRSENDIIFREGMCAGNFETTCRLMGDLFRQWNQTRQQIGVSESIYYSRLYLNCENTYTEENSVLAYNMSEERNTECKFVFDNLERFGAVSEIRWDPGEGAATTVYKLSVDVDLTTAEHFHYELSDFITNGIIMKDRVVFVGPDPIFVKGLDVSGVIKRVVIYAVAIPSISLSDSEYIKGLMRHDEQEKVSLLKRVVRKIRNLLS